MSVQAGAGLTLRPAPLPPPSRALPQKVPRICLQLVAVACVQIASKSEEVRGAGRPSGCLLALSESAACRLWPSVDSCNSAASGQPSACVLGGGMGALCSRPSRQCPRGQPAALGRGRGTPKAVRTVCGANRGGSTGAECAWSRLPLPQVLYPSVKSFTYISGNAFSVRECGASQR